jgi:Uma2 family endonuclease
VQLPIVTEWTPEVLEGLSDEYRYEVHGGNLVVMSAARRAWHADVQSRVWALLRSRGLHAYIEQGITLEPGETRTCDIGVFHQAPEPDRAYHPAAAFRLVVEVVSPGSAQADRVDKPRDYAAAGVPEYWRVEEAQDGGARVHRHTVDGAGYVEVAVEALADLES